MSLVTVERGTGRHKALRYGAIAAFLLLLLYLPFGVFDEYRNGQMTQIFVYAVGALGLNLLVGYAGQISLGHGAFYALGAYACAILITKASVPYLLAIPAAGVVCFIAGFLVGIPALRLRGLYLALVTLALAVAMPQLIKKFEGLTGGTQGLQVPPPEAPGWLPVLNAQDQYIYLLALVTTVICFFLASKMVSGRVGRALIAIRDNEIAAKTQGVNLATYKTRAFAVSAAYAGIAGALFVFSIGGFVAPESFTLIVSFSFLAAIVVGGLATIWGAVLGAIFIELVTVFPQEAGVPPAWSGVVFGAALILFMFVLPHGLMQPVRWLGRRIVEVRPGPGGGGSTTAQPPLGPGGGGAGRSTDETSSPAGGMRPAQS